MFGGDCLVIQRIDSHFCSGRQKEAYNIFNDKIKPHLSKNPHFSQWNAFFNETLISQNLQQ